MVVLIKRKDGSYQEVIGNCISVKGDDDFFLIVKDNEDIIQLTVEDWEVNIKGEV